MREDFVRRLLHHDSKGASVLRCSSTICCILCPDEMVELDFLLKSVDFKARTFSDTLVTVSDRSEQESFCASALLFGRSRSRTKSKKNSKILLLPEAQGLLLKQKFLPKQKYQINFCSFSWFNYYVFAKYCIKFSVLQF